MIYTDNGSNVSLDFGLDTIHEQTVTTRKAKDSTLYIGKSGKEDEGNFVGVIYELVIFNKVLTMEQKKEIHDMLSNKWELKTSLASNICINNR